MDEYRRVVEDVLEHLTPWRLVDDTRFMRAEHPEMPEAAIWFRCRDRRLHVSGAYPRDFGPYEDAPHISVSARRDPAVIARDIERRFLPAYLEAFADAMEQANREALRQRAEYEALDGLADILGVEAEHYNDGRQDLIYLRQGKIKVLHSSRDGTRVQIHLEYLPLELAVQVCKALAG